MTTLLITIAALALGYLLGRIRPWNRFADWAEWQLRLHPGHWIGTRHRELLLFTALAITKPRSTLRAWRHRNDPPPPRSPAVRFDPNWRANRPDTKEPTP